jgi:hypothetical protein
LPDIWRKFLLDYSSLGAAYKYAGTMTGHEVEIIDKKLDRHMASKAVRGAMSHLLIDRFRFDSFVPAPEGYESTRPLTRFGDLVDIFFMITPPEMTVERAWTRGLKGMSGDGVDQPDRVACENCRGRRQLCEERCMSKPARSDSCADSRAGSTPGKLTRIA